MEDKKTILYARSKENGVVFYSNKVPALCYEAYLDEKGDIRARPQPGRLCELRDYCGMLIADKKERQKNLIKYLKIALWVLAILSIVITKKVTIAFGLVYFSLLAVKELVELGTLVFEVKFGDLKSTGRFHSAEHMTIAAYEKYQRIPTMEEVKAASRFDKKCGSRLIIDQVVFWILLTMIICSCAFIPVLLYFGLAAILMVLTIAEREYNFLRVLQLLLTNKPTDKELEVALAGIELFENLETQMPEDSIMMGMVIMEFHRPCDDSEEHDAETD